MNETWSRNYSMIAAICFACVAAYRVVNVPYKIFLRNGYASFLLNVSPVLLLVAFAIILFAAKRSLGIVIVAFFNFLYYLYRSLFMLPSIPRFLFLLLPGKVTFFQSTIIGSVDEWKLSLYMIVEVVVSVLLIVIACIPHLVPRATLVKKLWFLPGALMFLFYVFFTWTEVLPNSQYVGFWAAIQSLESVAYFFTGKWIVYHTQPVQQEKGKILGSQPVNTFAFDSETSEATRLEMCKELFDTGIITEEEYEQKKKQILRL